MTIFDGEPLDSERAKLALNARLFKYDKRLDEAADLYDVDVDAWSRLPLVVRDHASIYADLRAAYRRAVSQGAVADNRGPNAAEGNASW